MRLLLLGILILTLTSCSSVDWHTSYNREHVVVCQLLTINSQLSNRIRVLEGYVAEKVTVSKGCKG